MFSHRIASKIDVPRKGKLLYLGLKRKAEEMNKEPDGDNVIQKTRTRVHYTKEQLLLLESEFDQNNYPDIFQKEDLAAKLNVKKKNVHVSLDCIYIQLN